MSKKKAVIIVSMAIGVLILGISGYFLYLNYFKKKTEEKPAVKVESLKLDPEKEATHLSKVAGEDGAVWMRGFPIIWNDIEEKQGELDWSKLDKGLIEAKDGYFSGEAYHLPIVWPYANWDQKSCHSGEKYKATGHLKGSGEDTLLMGSPCDMKAYAGFIEKLVERYDGDGVDDAKGLKTPIKYWEIMNEPEMQGGMPGGAGEDLKFFVGTSQEYLEILKTSYTAIKKSDPEAKVAHAGMAGMQQNFKDFWGPIFAGGAGNYFDIANIHTINTDESREDMFVTAFKEYLASFGISGKPIWVTELQYGNLMGKPKDIPAFEKLMARSTVFALSRGAEKLFYIETWTQWDNPNAYKEKEPEIKDKKDDGVDYQDKKKEDEKSKPKMDLSKSSAHKVYKNLLSFLNHFDKVEVIKEEVATGQDPRSKEMGGVSARVGQYKFTYKNKVLYVLWGQAPIPAEIKGTVKVTDIYGASKEIDVSTISLSDSPVFVELK